MAATAATMSEMTSAIRLRLLLAQDKPQSVAYDAAHAHSHAAQIPVARNARKQDGPVSRGDTSPARG
jgi:hypothetical protein